MNGIAAHSSEPRDNGEVHGRGNHPRLVACANPINILSRRMPWALPELRSPLIGQFRLQTPLPWQGDPPNQALLLQGYIQEIVG